MPASEDILKEFLVSVGFHIDPASARRFTDTILKTDGLLGTLGKTAAGAATAAVGATIAVADQFEKLYFVSQRTGASVKGIKALQAGFQQIGLSAQQATQVVSQFGSNLVYMRGFVDQFLGHKTSGQDTAATILEIFNKLKTLPTATGAGIANQLFGTDLPTFQQIMLNFPEFVDYIGQYIKKTDEVGDSQDELAKKSHELMVGLRGVTQSFTTAGEALALKFIGPLQEGVTWLDKINKSGLTFRGTLDSMQQGTSSFFDTAENQVANFIEYVNDLNPFRQSDTDPTGKRKSAFLSFLDKATSPVDAAVAGVLGLITGHPVGLLGDNPSTASTAYPGPGKGGASGGADLGAMADAAADKAGVNRALFRALIGTESSWNVNARPHKKDGSLASSAFGLTQLLSGTASDLGVDPYNVADNLRGGATYLAQQLTRFGGDPRLAVNAFHNGPGGAYTDVPDYTDKALALAARGGGGPITVSTSVTVQTSSNDPKAIGQLVADEANKNINKTALRNLAPGGQ